jgi:hypothetical protein
MDHDGHAKGEETHRSHGQAHYSRLLVMALISFAAMFLLMYAMVDRPANVVFNVNQVYMAALMTAPMVVIELGLMRSMYPNWRLNAFALGISALVFVAAFLAIRLQVGVSDGQFLRSMIPHHAGAILMCEEARVRDPEVVKLCDGIKSSQQAEIEQMKTILERSS